MVFLMPVNYIWKRAYSFDKQLTYWLDHQMKIEEYIYIYIHIHIHTYTYTHIHTHTLTVLPITRGERSIEL